MINITAEVSNTRNDHDVTLTTNGNSHSITIPPKATGFGSSANGGELLFLALATCFCNDIYREAAKRGITVRSVKVDVSGDFDDAPGSVASNIHYRASIEAEADTDAIRDLAHYTDTVAEIQNTLRLGTSVIFESVDAIPVT